MPNFRKNCQISGKIVSFSKIVGEIQQLVRKFSQKTNLQCNFSLYFTSYLSIAFSKIQSHSKIIKNAKKLSVFGENDFRRWSNFLQIHIFWKFDHISRAYNQNNHRNIWFSKVTLILIMMTLVLFFDSFFEKDPHLNAVEFALHKSAW